VHGAESGAGEDGHDGLRDHRHIDDDAVTLIDPVCCEDTRESRDLVKKLRITDRTFGVSYRTVIDDRRLVTAAALDMPIDCVVAGVEPATCKPTVGQGVGVIENALPAFVPVYSFSRFGPEFLRVVDRGAMR